MGILFDKVLLRYEFLCINANLCANFSNFTLILIFYNLMKNFTSFIFGKSLIKENKKSKVMFEI